MDEHRPPVAVPTVRPSLFVRLIVGTVDRSRRHAVTVVLAGLALGIGLGIYAAGHLGINANTSNLISPKASWRALDDAFDAAFPQNADQLVVVVDAATPEEADLASAALVARLKAEPPLFKTVRQPTADPFFKKNGLLYLSPEEVSDTTNQLIKAQPLLGELAADPSLRGLFNALALALDGVGAKEASLADFDRPFKALADSLQATLAGHPKPVSWQTLLTGRAATTDDLRRVILVQPVLDYQALEPGKRASNAIRAAARDLGLTPDRGVRVRLTGSVALSDDEFASLTHGIGYATTLSLTLVGLFLFLAVRSPKLILAIATTLVVGLVATAAFAGAAIGSLNLISVAFAVLFVGLAVDFGIQFAVRFRDWRYHVTHLSAALREAAAGMSTSLPLAAATTAVGFYAFVPSDYAGVRELGLIAGTGMLIALVLNFTLLPAMIALLRPGGEPEAVGFAGAGGLDRVLVERRRWVALAGVLLALAGIATLPFLRFDFDPLNLKDPHSESMSTLLDLMGSPTATPYTIKVLRPSVAAADQVAEKLKALPEVDKVITVSSLVPTGQKEKLDIIHDAAFVLERSLTPPAVAEAPTDAETLKAMGALAAKLRKTAEGRSDGATALRLANALDAVGHASPPPLAALRDTLVAGLRDRLADLRLALSAEPVTLASLPASLKSDWVAADGRARVEVFPKGNGRDNPVLERFVKAVRTVAPDAIGAPVTIQESARIVVRAFITAGILAVAAITILLAAVLRRALDVLLVLAPLFLAALLTASASVLFDLPLNFANIIALPLMLGIGVAFEIYFVINWRAGHVMPLQSSTARAILFSGLTTGAAFGSLAISNHRGTAGMGELLMIALFFTLGCTLFFLPALLALAPRGTRR
jgi:hopanoid biosynthesis associated RND transporter like protein HpnN